MQAPELQVSEWLNTDRNLKLSDFHGKVVLIEAFQMLCPGCVVHGILLAQEAHRYFPRDQVAVAKQGERLVSTPCSSAENDTVAAILLLRARAARI